MWQKARKWFATKLVGLPIEHHYDAAGNNWVTLRGASEKTLLIGGHLDSVPNGGWLDGSLNVLAGLEVLRRFAAEFKGKPPVTIRLVDWADEEGARFGRSLLGSSAFAGTHSHRRRRGSEPIKTAVTMEDALRRCGVHMDRFPEAEKERDNAAAYIWNCTSSRGRCLEHWACRWAWCWAPREWSGTRSRFTGRRRTPARRR